MQNNDIMCCILNIKGFYFGDGIIKIILFTLLLICSLFYLFFGMYTYKIDKKSKANYTFTASCILCSLWAIGYAAMIVSTDIKTVCLWRLIAAFGYCFFFVTWFHFAFSLNNSSTKDNSKKVKLLLYIPAIIFFIHNLTADPTKLIAK